MEYDAYLRHYKESDSDKIEAHLHFAVKTGTPNPDFPEWHANEIERRLKEWQEEEYPGLTFQRNGLIFKIDMVAFTSRSGHVDYFERVLMTFSNSDFYERLDNPKGLIK